MTRTIKGALQAAIFGGALGVLPMPAFADEAGEGAPGVQDHAQIEARAGNEQVIPTSEKTERVPDHAQAEARGNMEAAPPAAELRPGVPDHAQAERRGADTDTQ